MKDIIEKIESLKEGNDGIYSEEYINGYYKEGYEDCLKAVLAILKEHKPVDAVELLEWTNCNFDLRSNTWYGKYDHKTYTTDELYNLFIEQNHNQ